MSTITTASQAVLNDDVAEIVWRSWPLREAAPLSWLVPAGVLAVAGLVQMVVGSTPLSIATLLILLLSLWRFFVPIRYTVSRDGVLQEFWGQRRWIGWHAVGKYQVHEQGIVLYRAAQPIGLDALWSVYVPCGNRCPEVLGLLHRYARRLRQSPSAQ